MDVDVALIKGDPGAWTLRACPLSSPLHSCSSPSSHAQLAFPSSSSSSRARQGIKDVPLGSLEFDLMDYVSKVPAGKPKKFKIETKLNGSEINLKFQLDVKREDRKSTRLNSRH